MPSCKTAACFLRKSCCPRGHGSLLSALISRQCSSTSQQQQTRGAPKRSTFRPAPDSTHDWIGPPDLVSNLRPIVYCIPENETELEKRLRNLRQETEDWNHEFWTKQNITFRKEKDAYITSTLNAQGLSQRDELGRKRTLNSEEMAVFYKSFLDNNRIRHSNYNKEWYKRNFTITLYMARVVLHSTWRNITERLRLKKNNTPAT